jgi:F0F1-type ATP synthase delta subunit
LAQKSLGKLSESAFSKEIAAYLIAERRVSDLDSIIRDIIQYRADHGIVEVIAVSAHALTDAIRKQIESQVKKVYPEAQQVIISYQADDTVVGGVKLEFANQQLDLTVRNTLNRFKQLTV